MYKLISRLLLFGELGADSILRNVADIIRDSESENADKDELVQRSFR